MTAIAITGEWLERNKAMAIPGAYWDREARSYVLKDPTPRAAAVALRLFPALANEHPELLDLRASLSQEVRPLDNATAFGSAIRAERIRDVLRADGHDLYEFQDTDLGYAEAVLNQHGAFYLGWERGLGKTIGAESIMDELELSKVLVVCPNTAKESVWAADLRRFCPWLETVVMGNTARQRENCLGYCQQLLKAGLPFVLVTHYESLAIIEKLRSNNRGWSSLFGEWDLIVADECHRISNAKTQQAKALKRIPTQLKLALSGTIFANHLEELFSQAQWLFPALYRSKWRDWNDRWLDYVENGYGRVCVGVKIEKLEEMRTELGVWMVYRRKEDELDLPERTEETRYVTLSLPQRKAYEDLRDTCIAQLSDGSIVTAQDGLVLLTRLRQVATGLDLVSGGVCDSAKQDLAVELIQDNPDEAFVVFSWYKRAARSLAERLERLGIGTFVVDGDTKPDDRASYISQFQAGAGRVFVGTLSTLGESVTLHRASNAIFLDRSWNPGTNAQAADRIYRIGQAKPVTITHIIAKDTVDELRVAPVVADKEALRRLILGA